MSGVNLVIDRRAFLKASGIAAVGVAGVQRALAATHVVGASAAS